MYNGASATSNLAQNTDATAAAIAAGIDPYGIMSKTYNPYAQTSLGNNPLGSGGTGATARNNFT